MSSNLYERYGGEDFCKKVDNFFYDELMLRDPVTMKYFAQTDINR